MKLLVFSRQKLNKEEIVENLSENTLKLHMVWHGPLQGEVVSGAWKRLLLVLVAAVMKHLDPNSLIRTPSRPLWGGQRGDRRRECARPGPSSPWTVEAPSHGDSAASWPCSGDLAWHWRDWGAPAQNFPLTSVLRFRHQHKDGPSYHLNLSTSAGVSQEDRGIGLLLKKHQTFHWL